MNKLYIVTLYNHSYNFKQRYALTAQHEEAADTTALVQAGKVGKWITASLCASLLKLFAKRFNHVQSNYTI